MTIPFSENIEFQSHLSAVQVCTGFNDLVLADGADDVLQRVLEANRRRMPKG